MFKLIRFIIIIIIIIINPVFAKTLDDRESVGLVIYNRDLGMVQERRVVNLDDGANRIDFHHIAPGVYGNTVSIMPLIDSEKAKSKIHTRAVTYNFDLVNQEKMLQTYTGRWFSFSADEATYAGRLLHFDATHIFLQPDTLDPMVLVVERGKLKEMFYPGLPEGLFTRPTLRWEVEADKKFDDLTVELAYLTGGITWMCDYRGELIGDSLALSANFTIANDINLSFPKASITLVAGKPHRSDDPAGGGSAVNDELSDKRAIASGSQTRSPGERLDEYYRYRLPNPIDLHNGQTVQVPFFSQRKVRVERRYVYPHLLDDRIVRTKIRFKNDNSFWSEPSALPEGEIGLYRKDKDAALIFIGEDAVSGTPVGGEIELDLGTAFDLTARRIRVAQARPARDRQEETWRIEAVNGKDVPVTIYVEQRVYGYYTVTAADLDGKAVHPEKDAADRLYFPMAIPARSSATLNWTVSYGY